MLISKMVVTGLGMVSCVGHNVDMACASIRAGISRPSSFKSYESLLPGLEKGNPIIVHNIDGVTNGFYMVGLWIRMSQLALENLIHRESLENKNAKFWSDTGLTVVLPILDPERFLLSEPLELKVLKQVYCDSIFETLPVELPIQNITIIAGGHSAVAGAVECSVEILKGNKLKRMIILGVDSYADATSVAWVAEQNRLKTDHQPDGLSPGEAAACFLVENEDEACDRGAIPYGRIAAVSVDKDEKIQNGKGFGRALSKTILDCLNGGAEFRGSIITDCNGELWRAQEFGSAQVQYSNRMRNYNVKIPCEALGETGAASAAIGVCLAICAFTRNYALYDTFLVTSVSENGNVGSFRIEKI